MSSFISVLLGALIVFPFFVTFLFLIFLRSRGKVPVKAIGLAADITTPFLFLAVYIISRTIFGDGSGYTIAVIAISSTIAIAVHERLKVKEFQIVRLLRKTWRFFFLILVVAYVLLLGVGLISKIIDYTQ